MQGPVIRHAAVEASDQKLTGGQWSKTCCSRGQCSRPKCRGQWRRPNCRGQCCRTHLLATGHVGLNLAKRRRLLCLENSRCHSSRPRYWEVARQKAMVSSDRSTVMRGLAADRSGRADVKRLTRACELMGFRMYSCSCKEQVRTVMSLQFSQFMSLQFSQVMSLLFSQVMSLQFSQVMSLQFSQGK